LFRLTKQDSGYSQAVILTIQMLTHYELLKMALDQWAEFPDPNWGADNPIDEEAVQREIDAALSGLDLNLSQVIIEDREDRF
jgi:hypothetical protein